MTVLRVGALIRNKWRIDARLARGGVATVYAATHRNNGNRVALKILHPEYVHAKEVTSRFAKEGYLANMVEHPGVVRVLDDDVTEDGRPFLVMELLTGELLEEKRLRNGGKLSPLMTLNVGIQILDVLAAAHAKEIVHRDLKPENVFMTHDGVVKLLDFGIARAKQSVGTVTGLLVGTAEFMAPEQALGKSKEISERTDIWGVGATLFILRAGEPVHLASSLGELLNIVATIPARSLGLASPDTPASLVAVIDKALCMEQSDRWATAQEMRSALIVARQELHDRELEETTHGVEFSKPPEAPVSTTAPPRSVPRPTRPPRPAHPTLTDPIGSPLVNGEEATAMKEVPIQVWQKYAEEDAHAPPAALDAPLQQEPAPQEPIMASNPAHPLATQREYEYTIDESVRELHPQSIGLLGRLRSSAIPAPLVHVEHALKQLPILGDTTFPIARVWIALSAVLLFSLILLLSVIALVH